MQLGLCHCHQVKGQHCNEHVLLFWNNKLPWELLKLDRYLLVVPMFQCCGQVNSVGQSHLSYLSGTHCQGVRLARGIMFLLLLGMNSGIHQFDLSLCTFGGHRSCISAGLSFRSWYTTCQGEPHRASLFFFFSYSSLSLSLFFFFFFFYFPILSAAARTCKLACG